MIRKKSEGYSTDQIRKFTFYVYSPYTNVMHNFRRQNIDVQIFLSKMGEKLNMRVIQWIIAIQVFAIASLNAQSGKEILIKSFITDYYDQFRNKVDVENNITSFYADTLLVFHGTEILSPAEALKKDIKDFDRINSFDISITNENLNIKEYWDMILIDLKLVYKIQEKNNETVSHLTNLRVALNKSCDKIIAIGENLNYCFQLRHNLKKLETETIERVIGKEPYEKFFKFQCYTRDFVGWNSENSGPWDFGEIDFDEGVVTFRYHGQCYYYYPFDIIGKSIIWYDNLDTEVDCLLNIGMKYDTKTNDILGVLTFLPDKSLRVNYQQYILDYIFPRNGKGFPSHYYPKK